MIESYLIQREKYVKVNEEKPEKFVVNGGVPRGSPESNIFHLLHKRSPKSVNKQLYFGYVDDSKAVSSDQSTMRKTSNQTAHFDAL